MKKYIAKLKTGRLLIVLALILGIAACGVHRGPHHMDQEKILKRMTKKLDLNETQKGKLQVVLENAANFKTGIQTRHGELTRDLASDLQTQQLDTDALNMQLSEMENEFTAFRQLMVLDFSEFHASLDDAQREKLAKSMERFEKHKHR